jgi:hypothetical protein
VPVPLDGFLLEPAPGEHQKRERGDEIKIDEPVRAAHPREHGPGVRGGEAKRNREINVQHTLAQAAP